MKPPQTLKAKQQGIQFIKTTLYRTNKTHLRIWLTGGHFATCDIKPYVLDEACPDVPIVIILPGSPMLLNLHLSLGT